MRTYGRATHAGKTLFLIDDTWLPRINRTDRTGLNTDSAARASSPRTRNNFHGGTLVCTGAFRERQATPNHRLQAWCEFASQKQPILPSRSRQVCRGQIARQANARLPPPRRPLREILPPEPYRRVREAHRHKLGCRKRKQRRPPRLRHARLGCVRRQLSEHVRCCRERKSQPHRQRQTRQSRNFFPPAQDPRRKNARTNSPPKIPKRLWCLWSD